MNENCKKCLCKECKVYWQCIEGVDVCDVCDKNNPIDDCPEYTK